MPERTSHPTPPAARAAELERGGTDLPIRCRCGIVRGVARGVQPENGNRCICYCDDCQSFARFLGRADEILDDQGGTEIFQMAASGLELRQGRDQLACVRLRPSGLMRWHAGCCGTPIGNTPPDPRLAFVGWILACLDPSIAAPIREQALGPIRMRVHGRSARGDRSRLDAHDGIPQEMATQIGKILSQAQRGGARADSPFFEARTGEPIVTPKVLGEVERCALDPDRDGNPARER